MHYFEIYELRQANDGLPYATGPTNQQESEIVLPSVNSEYGKEIQDDIHRRTLQSHFLRMSCERKMDLITTIFFEARNLHSLAVILNIFFSVNTKLMFYSKVTIDSNTVYEQFVNDHDRMLDTVVLNETLLDDMTWFKTLDDSDQINVLTGLMRLAGGNIIKKMYWRLIKIFNERSLEFQNKLKRYTSRTSMDFPVNDGRLINVKENELKYSEEEGDGDYNTDCPMHKKVVEGRKQWQAAMAKLKKEIDTEVQKLNEPTLQRIREKEREKTISSDKPTGKKTGKESQSKSAFPRNQNETMDWVLESTEVQLLPVWTVKKIFNYLDEKTLTNLRNVNVYWATISREVIMEKKARQNLDSTFKKSQDYLNVLLNIPDLTTDLEIDKTLSITETTGFRKRMEKQRRTGASLRQFKTDPATLHNKSPLSECFALFENEHAPFLSQLKPFPIALPITQEPVEIEKSIDVSMTDQSLIKSKAGSFAEVKSPKKSVEALDNVSLQASIMSLVPSIIVSEENLNTW